MKKTLYYVQVKEAVWAWPDRQGTLVPGSYFLTKSEFSLTWRLAENALLVNDMRFRRGRQMNRSSSGDAVSDPEVTAKHSFYHCPRDFPLLEYVGDLIARMESENVLYHDFFCVCDNVAPSNA